MLRLGYRRPCNEIDDNLLIVTHVMNWLVESYKWSPHQLQTHAPLFHSKHVCIPLDVRQVWTVQQGKTQFADYCVMFPRKLKIKIHILIQKNHIRCEYVVLRWYQKSMMGWKGYNTSCPQKSEYTHTHAFQTRFWARYKRTMRRILFHLVRIHKDKDIFIADKMYGWSDIRRSTLCRQGMKIHLKIAVWHQLRRLLKIITLRTRIRRRFSCQEIKTKWLFLYAHICKIIVFSTPVSLSFIQQTFLTWDAAFRSVFICMSRRSLIPQSACFATGLPGCGLHR